MEIEAENLKEKLGSTTPPEVESITEAIDEAVLEPIVTTEAQREFELTTEVQEEIEITTEVQEEIEITTEIHDMLEVIEIETVINPDVPTQAKGKPIYDDGYIPEEAHQSKKSKIMTPQDKAVCKEDE